MRMSQKCRNNIIKHNNNSDNALTPRRIDGGKKPLSKYKRVSPEPSNSFMLARTYVCMHK